MTKPKQAERLNLHAGGQEDGLMEEPVDEANRLAAKPPQSYFHWTLPVIAVIPLKLAKTTTSPRILECVCVCDNNRKKSMVI